MLDAKLRFGVLGPVVVWRGDAVLAVGTGRSRFVLALLLLHANEHVELDHIIGVLWGDQPPRSAVNLVHKYISELRKALGPEARLLTSVDRGYLLRVPPEMLDSGEFAGHLDEAAAAQERGDLVLAERRLDAALRLWRGPAFNDLECDRAVAERARLEEYRICAAEDLAEIALRSGRNAEAVAELSRLTAEYPFRERLRELQMLALYRVGRQAEALAVHDSVRRLLADELGTDPGHGLQQLYQQILRADPALDLTSEAPARPNAGPAGTVPSMCQLPPDIPDFTARAEYLDILIPLLTEPPAGQSSPVAVVVGAPGIGKSALSVHAAHMVRHAFPDGQLYLELAGTSDAPRDPDAMLAELLRALGVAGTAIPCSLHERTALYRTLLADRRVLLLLDDAAAASQIRPFLPATGGCAVLVTSRHRLMDLAGARHVDLDVFSPTAAHEFLTRIVGADRTGSEPEHAAAIVQACGYLPLAIRIAGAKLAGRQAWTLGVLKDRLRDESRRLSELKVGDLGVRASFDLSIRLLPEDAAMAFRLLGLLGAHTFPGWVLAPLLDRRHPDEVTDVLDTLLDANLLQLSDTDAVGQPRYRLHDLLRAYAAKAAEEDSGLLRRAALKRLLATWLDLAEQAWERMYPSLFRPTPGRSPRRRLKQDVTWPLLRDPVAWFDAERRTYLGAIHLAAAEGMDELACELAVAATPYYDHRILYEDWQNSHWQALRVARAAGNRRGQAALLLGLGQVHIYRDEYDQAAHAMRDSIELSSQTGDERGEALGLAGLATVARIRGHHDEALDGAKQALDLLAAVGDRHTEAQLHNAIGSILLAEGHHIEARTWFDDAMRISREAGDLHREAHVLRALSEWHDRDGEQATAMACLTDSLTIFHKLDDLRCTAYTLLSIGKLHVRHGEKAQAAEVIERAAVVFKQTGSDQRNEAECLRLLGELNATVHQDLCG